MFKVDISQNLDGDAKARADRCALPQESNIQRIVLAFGRKTGMLGVGTLTLKQGRWLNSRILGWCNPHSIYIVAKIGNSCANIFSCVEPKTDLSSDETPC